jgi:hypothetical protein
MPHATQYHVQLNAVVMQYCVSINAITAQYYAQRRQCSCIVEPNWRAEPEGRAEKPVGNATAASVCPPLPEICERLQLLSQW